MSAEGHPGRPAVARSVARASAQDRLLRRELLLLRGEIERQELTGSIRDLRASVEPATRAFRSMSSALEAGPVRAGLRWVQRHPLAGSLTSMLLGRIGRSAVGRAVGRVGARATRVAVQVGITMLAVRWIAGRLRASRDVGGEAGGPAVRG